MTVLDTSGVVDFLLGSGVAPEVLTILDSGPVAAPDILIFEVLAVLRRLALRNEVPAGRLDGCVSDLADVPIELFPALPLRARAWELRRNLTTADALFAVLAEHLGEPLATKDRALAAATRAHAAVDVRLLTSAD